METDIEYAALVHGWKSVCMPEGADAWDPPHDDGDSRRLEIACLNWLAHEPVFTESVSDAYDDYVELIHGRSAITPEQYSAAVFALAVAIGKVISAVDALDGGGV